jgi:signal transduction histidine kinase
MNEMKCRLLNYILLAAAVYITEAQDVARIDSLRQRIAGAEMTPDTALANLYFETGKEYEKTNIDSAAFFYRKAGDLSDRMKWTAGQFRFTEEYGGILQLKGLLDSALAVNERGLEIATASGNETYIATANSHIGNLYFYRNEYTRSLNYHLEAVAFFEKAGLKRYLAIEYDLIQINYYNLKDYDKAIEYGNRALNLMSGDPDNLFLCNIYMNLGNNYIDSRPRRYRETWDAYTNALRIAKIHNSLFNEFLIEINLAYYFYVQRNPDLIQAEPHLKRGLELCESFDIPYAHGILYQEMSDVEWIKGNFDKSRYWITKALEIAEKNHFTADIGTCCKMLANLALNEKDYIRHRDYVWKADSIRNELTGETALKSARELEVKYETEKKELQLAGQQAVIGRQRAVGFALAGGLALLAVILFLLWYMLWMRSKRNRALSALNTALGERNDALAEMNATKDKFFSIISHDLRNPALAQRNALQMLSDRSGQWDAATLKEFYRELLDSADSNVELLNNLLNWAQVQTGRMQFNPTATDLPDTIRDEIRQIRRMAEQKGVNFNVEMPDHAIVTADPRMLATIVRNLLTNAVKFTPEGGTVTLSVENIDATKTEITVADTGIGMTPEQIASLSRLDSRPSQRGTAGERGTGLGLTVCREMLERHGSTLQIESHPNRGSCFRFVTG